MKEQVLWAVQQGPVEPVAPADQALPDSVDVAIVGGGITGLAAALNLAHGGASVAVFDTHEVGWGASSRNGGMVSVGSKRPAASWVQEYGLEMAARLWQASVETVGFVEELIAREKIDCRWTRCGMLGAAWKPEHFGLLAAKQKFLADTFDYHIELVTPADVASELGTTRYHGASLDPYGGGLDPFLYVRGLAAAAVRAGALVFEHCAVKTLGRVGDEHQLVTERGVLAAADVLIATNGYTGPLTPELRRRVIPVGSHIIATEPLDADVAQGLIPKGRMVYDTKNMLYYFRLTPDDRLMFGGRAAWTPTTPQRSGAILHRKMLELYPQLTGTPIEYTWDGQVAMTFDFDPHAGTMGGLYFCMGYCGHGVAMSSYLGDRIADLIAGRPVDTPFFEITKFPTNPLYRGRPWFLPLAGGYYRTLDHLR